MLSNLGKHSSSQFTQEMESIRSDLLRMGGLVEQQVSDAVESFLQHDSKLAQKVRDVEKEVDSLEKQIDEECARVLALRQPAAIDLRTIIAVSKCVADLERMGDKAAKIAKITIQLADEGHLSIGLVEVRHIGERVCKMLHEALDAFARFDLDKAVAVAESDDDVDAEYHSAMRSLVTFMMEDPRSITRVLKLMSVFRALERIGDHCGNLCEQVVYLVSGRDVRHVSVEQMKAIVDKQGS
ncbi:MAG: phosphate signaling complex protein PhoU [Gammaproteobacteria bacterium]|mgnify:FL=1|jgi:phosphate transport system protein|nr:phosphate signaling complex protein PhoU [Gammaproteobacteria bacterium]